MKRLILWALAGIILVVSYLQLRNVYRSDSVNRAVRILGAEIRFARYLATTNNVHTAVLLPSVQDSGQGGLADRAYKARAIRVCTLDGHPRYRTSNTCHDGNFGAYIRGRKWEFLPVDVYVVGTPSFGDYSENPRHNRCNTVSGIRFPEDTSATRVDNMRAIILSPRGELIAPPAGAAGSDAIRIDLAIGLIDEGNHLWVRETDTEIVTLVINPLNGKLTFE